MFTLLSGRTVHEGETAQHLATLAATQPARSLATVVRDLPHDVVSLVDRALERDEAMESAIEQVRLQVAGSSHGAQSREVELKSIFGSTEAKAAEPSATATTARAVGSTTSQPVSWTAVTEAASAGPWRKTLSSAWTGLRVALGAGPVSSMAATERSPSAGGSRAGPLGVRDPALAETAAAGNPPVRRVASGSRRAVVISSALRVVAAGAWFLARGPLAPRLRVDATMPQVSAVCATFGSACRVIHTACATFVSACRVIHTAIALVKRSNR
jgi:hypothetical protein